MFRFAMIIAAMACLVAPMRIYAGNDSFVPKVDVIAAGSSAAVTVNGVKAMVFKSKIGRLSPVQRAKVVACRLGSLLHKYEKRDLSVKSISDKQVGIFIGGAQFITITESDGADRGMDAMSLARSWSKTLSSCFSMKPLDISPAALTVPLGESRLVNVRSLNDGEIRVAVSNPDVIGTDRKSDDGSIVVTGVAAGNAELRVECGEYTTSTQVSVKEYAGHPLGGISTAIITGWSPSQKLIAQTVYEAACRSVVLEPGARISGITPVGKLPYLRPGESAEIAVRVQVSGDGYLANRFQVTVRLNNRMLPGVQASELIYSNDPEQVEKYQDLCIGRIENSKGSIRLLYHHENKMVSRIGFVVDVINSAAEPASLHVIDGSAKPMINPVHVGYQAGLKYLENSRDGNGRVFDLPGKMRRVMVSQTLEPGYTASGILEFRALSGGPFQVRVRVKPESNRAESDQMDRNLPGGACDPNDPACLRNVYPSPLKRMDVTYTAGGSWTFVRLGKSGLRHASDNSRLDGDYGVIYDIDVKIDNPLVYTHPIDISFEATAGTASGIFFIDSKMQCVKDLDYPGEKSICRLTIAPHTSKVLHIRTMPLSGSSYPATIVIRPADMQAGR